MPINQEKQKIIEIQGNVLVTANPGTGKTLLLAYKYADLIRKGIGPEQILCLTFTEKAKKEMETRILEVIKEQKLSVDISNLNVFTFHSYALDNIEENEILSTNLLRYTILKYLKDNEILNYSDEYLLETIVPKMENLMRYLKSFGITPDKVNIAEAKKFLEQGKNYTKEEIDKFAEYFLDIFEHYEQIKNKRGVDYADLLIKFLALREHSLFDYVLVDELQDVNIMEADIALKSGKTFFAVGDKKQAIFGFQGGSILNFKKFEDSKQSVLSENFRSTNEILFYARDYFVSRTKEPAHKEELKDLCSAKGKTGPKPVVYDISRDKVYAAACELAKGLNGKTAIIARTNYQIMDLSRELTARGMDFSSTFFSASNDAKNHIIAFLKGVLSSDVHDIKNAMFTPFFPCSLQQAFELSSERNIEGIYLKVPAFRQLREMVKTVEDVNTLFRERIIPICISYGKEYLSAGITMQAAYQEAISVLDDKNMNSLMSYLQSTDLLSQESDVEKDIVLTTVHKAKGKEFDNVIYIPSKTSDKSNFQDNVVEGILKSKGINVEEELEEETLRVNFVAFTRAENKLTILTDKVQDYLNDYAELGEIKADEAACLDLNESKKRAFDLFVNKEFDEAKELLDSKDNWIKDFVGNYFKALEHISFSSLPEKAYDYFVDRILGIRKISFAVSLGSEVHEAAKKILLGKEYSVSEQAKPFVENVKKLIEKIKENYPDDVKTEMSLEPQLLSLGFGSPLKFKSFIDAVFRKGDKYLIVDWKTDKKTDYASKHRQQLEAYRRVFSAKENIPIDKVKVAIGYIGLRSTINTGQINCELDIRQPAKSAFETFSKRVNLLLSWIERPEGFFEALMDEKTDDMLWRSVVEEYKKED